uniref:Oxidoreductase n=1 Tax=Ascaris lumbricoides TaxID=6252 RepID=A0A0M3IJI9_ASCLU
MQIIGIGRMAAYNRIGSALVNVGNCERLRTQSK